MVTFSISSDLIYPELHIGFWYSIVLTPFMSMPKTAIYKNTGSVFPQYNIRPSRKTWVVQAITIAMVP